MGFTFAVHNHYLWLWFELGVVGLGSYLLVIAQLLITARRAAAVADSETSRYLIAFIYGCLAMSFAVLAALLFRPWLYICAYTALTMRMALIATQTSKEPRQSGVLVAETTLFRPRGAHVVSGKVPARLGSRPRGCDAD